MGKLLVTGAMGFVGTSCLNVLKNYELEVYATDINCEDGYRSGITYIKNDLSDAKQTRELVKFVSPDYLMHLAWDVDPELKKSELQQKRWIDISLNLINCFKRNGGRRVIIAGTCAEYKWGHYIYDEKLTPLKPDTVYGIYKNKLHQKVSAYCLKNRLSYAWGRLFYLYGPNDDERRLVPQIINNIIKGNPVKTTHGNQVYDYLYVDDVSRALAMLIENSYNGPVNICSGKPHKIKDLILLIANYLDGLDLIRLGSMKARGSDPDYVVGNNARLKKITNWQQQISISEGLKRTIQSVLTHGK